MKEIYIQSIRAGGPVGDYFLVKQKELCRAKNDKPYLSLKLCDSSGEIEARIWDDAEYFGSLFDRGDVILIKRGTASVYQKRMQIVINDLEKADGSEMDMSCFIESSSFSSEEMLSELRGYIKKINNGYLKKLLDMFFQDTSFVAAFCRSPAAKSVHHAYLGGLLEHTLSVTRLVSLFSQNYDYLNKDILVSGAILHDIGKTEEISPDIGFDYTDSGRLIGHIVTGVLMLEKRIGKIKGFPVRLADVLKHMILSHHGIYEWGSPKKPKTLEALALHYADDLDAKLMIFRETLNKSLGEAGSGWTGYNSFLERFLLKEDYNYKGEPALESGPAGEEKPKKQKTPDDSQISMFKDDS